MRGAVSVFIVLNVPVTKSCEVICLVKRDDRFIMKGYPILLLEGHWPAEFSSNPN